MTIAIDIGTSSAIADYSDLVDKVKLFLDRGSELDQLIPTFITLAEGYLNRVLRVPDMEANGTAVVINGTFPLPDDFLQMRGVRCGGLALEGYSPATLLDTFGGMAGVAGGYAISGRTVMVAPVSAAPVTFTYWRRIPKLTLNTPSNWLLTTNSDIYLYGALLSAETYIDNPERVEQWRGAFEASVDQLQIAGSKAQFGGPIRMRSGVRQMSGVRA